jgi:hypothetical protein
MDAQGQKSILIAPDPGSRVSRRTPQWKTPGQGRPNCRRNRQYITDFPIAPTLLVSPTPLVSLPGLTGQSSTPGLCLLDRPVEPGDDSEFCGAT